MGGGKKPDKAEILAERARQESERYKRDRLRASEQDAARQKAIDDAAKNEDTEPE